MALEMPALVGGGVAADNRGTDSLDVVYPGVRTTRRSSLGNLSAARSRGADCRVGDQVGDDEHAGLFPISWRLPVFILVSMACGAVRWHVPRGWAITAQPARRKG